MEIIHPNADYSVVEVTSENIVIDTNVENLEKTIKVNGFGILLEKGFRPVSYIENGVFVGVGPTGDILIIDLFKGILSPEFVSVAGHDSRLTRVEDITIDVKVVKMLDDTNGQEFPAWQVICKGAGLTFCDALVA